MKVSLLTLTVFVLGMVALGITTAVILGKDEEKFKNKEMR